MRESLMYGSVRGARGNSRPYRDEAAGVQEGAFGDVAPIHDGRTELHVALLDSLRALNRALVQAGIEAKIVLAFKVVVLDRHILAFNVAGFVEPFAKRGRNGRGVIGRSVCDKCDHRQRRVLRARGERPGSRRSPKQCDKLASAQMIWPHLPSLVR